MTTTYIIEAKESYYRASDGKIQITKGKMYVAILLNFGGYYYIPENDLGEDQHLPSRSFILRNKTYSKDEYRLERVNDIIDEFNNDINNLIIYRYQTTLEFTVDKPLSKILRGLITEDSGNIPWAELIAIAEEMEYGLGEN